MLLFGVMSYLVFEHREASGEFFACLMRFYYFVNINRALLRYKGLQICPGTFR